MTTSSPGGRAGVRRAVAVSLYCFQERKRPMWPLLAVRSAWVAVFFVGIGVFVLWFLLRVAADLVTWFKEEILDDYRELRETSEGTRRKLKTRETSTDRK